MADTVVKKRYISHAKNLSVTVIPGGSMVGPGGQAIMDNKYRSAEFRPVFGRAEGELVTGNPELQEFLEHHRMFRKGPSSEVAAFWEDRAYFEFAVTPEKLQQHRKSIGMTEDELGELIGYSGAFVLTLESGESGITEAIKAKLRQAKFFEEETQTGSPVLDALDSTPEPPEEEE